MRFGKWDDILAEPDNYPDYMPFRSRISSWRTRDLLLPPRTTPGNARKEQAIFRELCPARSKGNRRE
jgi:hypothetical protein